MPAPTLVKKRRALSSRRAILLATTIAGLGVGGLFIAPGFNYSPAALAQNLSEQAQSLAAPIGFADIVEKVKPAVISVRVKIDGATTGSADRPAGTLRRFGMPILPQGTPNRLSHYWAGLRLQPEPCPMTM